MQKLRGSGSTFSTSNKPWVPFTGNPKVAVQNARRARIVRKFHTDRLTKQQLRELAEAASKQAR